jgi:hypothetical protein
MRNTLKNIFSEIRRGENIDIYLGITVAIAVGLLGLMSFISLEVVSAAILTTLGLLASSLLVNRHSANSISTQLDKLDSIQRQIQEMSSSSKSLDDVFRTRGQLPSLTEQVSNAQSIDLCGMSQLAMATRYRGMLLERARSGCHVRLLMLDPQNKNLMKMMSPFVGTQSVEAHTIAIATSLNYLASDKELLDSGFVQVRVYSLPISHGLMIIDGSTLSGRIRVEIYANNAAPADCPGFYIHKNKEPNLFNKFLTEFEQIWSQSQPVEFANSRRVKPKLNS